MNILFLGGTGNISTDCAVELHRRGHRIGVVSRGNQPVPSEYTAINVDRYNADALRAAVKDFNADVVINFLGFSAPDVRLDHAVFNGKIRQYIFISTAMVYAKPHRQLPVTESAPLGNDYSNYAKHKLEAERWLLEKFTRDKFPVTIVRPSHTYCNRWFPNLVCHGDYTFAARLEQNRPVFVPDDGSNPWTLTATSDFAIGLAGLAGNDRAIGETFHITSDEALTWNQIFAETAHALGAANATVLKIPTEAICEAYPPLSDSLIGDKCNPGIFDNAKIKQFVPDFVCRKPFHKGIAESAEWYRHHPEQKIINPKADAIFDTVVNAWRAK